MNYKIAEKFISVNGEGQKSGELSTFIRFKYCNLNCVYCDTKWANDKLTPYETNSEVEIFEFIKNSKIKNVTLTGGEPLLQKDLKILLDKTFEIPGIEVEIETNGSIDIKDLAKYRKENNYNVYFTLDYKLPYSKMEKHMNVENYKFITKKDSIKFVIGSREDLNRAYEVIKTFKLIEKSNVYFSSVFGEISLEKIVEFLKEKNLNNVKLQLQLHKYIWDPSERGV